MEKVLITLIITLGAVQIVRCIFAYLAYCQQHPIIEPSHTTEEDPQDGER